MYNHLMVCCLKASGKVLREFKDTVYVPFGQEYSILLKNLNTKRAVVDISIDGVDVTGGGLVIGGQQEIELERFVKDLSKGNKFKFIERTSKIENHRGVKIDDGLIRISFRYEQDVPIKQYINNYVRQNQWGPSFGFDGDSNAFITKGLGDFEYGRGIQCSTALRSRSLSKGESNSSFASASASSFSDSMPINDVGITVPGSESNQKFVHVDNFDLEKEEHVLVIKLLGQVNEQPVTQPISVTKRAECVTCGKLNKATAKFCSECGTSLSIF